MTATAENPTKSVEVLLVEDNHTDVYFIREALKQSKYSVRLGVVFDGVRALAYLRHQGHFANTANPDLILLDLNMPSMDGWEVLTEIKRDPHLQQIPVLVVTTSGNEEDKMRARELRAGSYIVKPMNMIQFPALVNAVERFLG
jgi:chemotaxis family two-component system response regulator Rcp1